MTSSQSLLGWIAFAPFIKGHDNGTGMDSWWTAANSMVMLLFTPERSTPGVTWSRVETKASICAHDYYLQTHTSVKVKKKCNRVYTDLHTPGPFSQQPACLDPDDHFLPLNPIYPDSRADFLTVKRVVGLALCWGPVTDFICIVSGFRLNTNTGIGGQALGRSGHRSPRWAYWQKERACVLQIRARG